MKLSFSTNAYVRQNIHHAIEKIADAGYEGVELLADIPHLNPAALSDTDLEEIGSLLIRKNLTVANINANTAMAYYGREFWEPLFEPSLSNPDPEARRWRIDYTKKCMDMALTLGSQNISITSGRMIPGVNPTESLALFRSSLNELLEYAEKKNIRIGVEYEPGLLIERYSELMVLLKQVDSAFLGANLDLGHSYLIDNDVAKGIHALSSKIFHLHIEDIKDMKHYHLIPGMGDMDFQAIHHALMDISYKGYASVELYTYVNDPDFAAQRSREVLMGIGFGASK